MYILRFFVVMAEQTQHKCEHLFIAKAVFDDKKIKVFNRIQFRMNGKMKENVTRIENLSVETVRETCRKCFESVSKNDSLTLECACNVKPVYHKTCIQFGWDTARLSGIGFVCSDCSTQISDIYDFE